MSPPTPRKAEAARPSVLRLANAVGRAAPIRVAVDAAFAGCLHDRFVGGTVNQIQLCYHALRTGAAENFRFTICDPMGLVTRELERRGGSSKWQRSEVLEGVDLFDHFDEAGGRQRLVYLTPDAKEPLDEVSSEDIYVVGGLNNAATGTTLSRALGHGVRAQRLPISEHVAL